MNNKAKIRFQQSSQWGMRFFTWYFSRRALPHWMVLACDYALAFCSMLMAYVFNHGLMEALSHFWHVVIAIAFYLAFYVIGFRSLRTYSGVVRFSSFVDLFRVVNAVIISTLVALMVCTLIPEGSMFASVGYLDLLQGGLITILLMSSLRIVMKLAYDAISHDSRASNVMIFGTKHGGVALAKSLSTVITQPFNLVGFISQYKDMEGHFLLNKCVLGYHDEKLWCYIDAHKVRVVLISPLVQDFFVNECQDMIDQLIRKGIRIMMLPQGQEWDGKTALSHTNLLDVSVEDLLPRKKIEVDLDAIGAMLKNKRILITGAAGSIGMELVHQVAKFYPEEMILIDQAETPMHDVRLKMANKYPYVKAHTIVTSITNETHMEQIFRDHRPQYVFHAAAYKHVPMMEDNPAMAVQNNVYGTRVIADMAVKYGAKKFVMISTDKAVNPTNVMGCSKRICEIYCQALNREIAAGKVQMDGGQTAVTQFVTTRFGNVLGSNGSVIPIFREQIMKGGPVTVTHPDIIRYFMLIPEACRLVLEAGTMGNGGEIFVFDMGEPVRIADLAQRMIDLMGAKDVEIKYTGLRNGEKLYEEVLSDDEQTKPTHHPKIKVACVREYPYAEALANEVALHELSFTYDDMAIVKKMKEIVPEYKSRQSKYEALD